MTAEPQQLLSRLAEDPDFRAELRADPVAALLQRGVELTDEQRATLREADLDVPDEQLAERISKARLTWSDVRLKRRVQAL